MCNGSDRGPALQRHSVPSRENEVFWLRHTSNAGEEEAVKFCSRVQMNLASGSLFLRVKTLKMSSTLLDRNISRFH